MVQRISSESLSALRAPLIAAVLAAGFLQPSAVRADEVPRAARSVVKLSAARDEIASFMQFFAAAETDRASVRGLMRRALGVPPKPATSQSNERAPDKSMSPVQQLISSDADPYFERWQKDANEKLEQEKAIRTVKQHPLALANPDKMVVVCEAGCRTPKDEIVYIAALIPAVEPPRKFDPTSSGASAPVDEGHMPCIAGCYEKPERNKPAAPARKADLKETPSAPLPASATNLTITGAITPVTVAQTPPKVRHRQIGLNGAIVDQRFASQPRSVRRAAHKSKNTRVTVLRGWRTRSLPAKAVPATINRAGGWSTTIVKQSTVLKRVKATDRIRTITRPAARGMWRTKIVFGIDTRHIVRH